MIETRLVSSIATVVFGLATVGGTTLVVAAPANAAPVSATDHATSVHQTPHHVPPMKKKNM